MVALIVAPVISAARAAHIDWRTAIIPIGVALLIWSKIPVVSNPILWIVLGAVGGILAFKRSMHNVVKSGEGHAG